MFGHIARWLIDHEGFRCTFISERKPDANGPINVLQYKPRGGARKTTHYCSRTFENFTWHTHAVYETLKGHPEVKPDLVVGHSGFGSTAFLPELYDCPMINYCEWFYRPLRAGQEFRSQTARKEMVPLRSRMRNAMLLLDLHTCTAGYSPTCWQRSQLPAEYQHKVETIFDGIDTHFWRRQVGPRVRRIGGRQIPPGTRIVTYVARGMEALRGFDVFMRVAQRICRQRRDVHFVCVGEDRQAYGDDSSLPEGKTFRDHVLSQEHFDMDRFTFTGRVAGGELVRILNLSDLHIYLTEPFVLSWSLLDAMACGCAVLGSDTEPLREMISHGRNGLLAPFFDVEGLTELALEVLDDPAAARPMRQAAVNTIRQDYSMDAIMPRMLDFYRRVAQGEFSAEGRDQETLPAPQHCAASPAENEGDGAAMQQLRAEAPWPERCPEVVLPDRRGGIRKAHRQMLSGLLDEHKAATGGRDGTTGMIVELGAATRLLTRTVAELAPRAEIIAVDRWQLNGNRLATPPWKAMVPRIQEEFFANCWEHRQRIVALPTTPAKALRQLHQAGAAPRLILLTMEHTGDAELEVPLARSLFPQAILAGNGWTWQRARRVIRQTVEANGMTLRVVGDLWSLRG